MQRVTIKDVATHAGVSITTASFALNNVTGRVSKEIRRQVLKSAEELNYTANVNARLLRTNDSNTVMLVYSHEFLLERNASTILAIAGAMKYARDSGKEVLLSTVDIGNQLEEMVEKYKEIWASRRVEGIVFQCHFEDERDDLLYKELYKAGVNLTNISRIGRVEDYPHVYLNDYEISREQVRFIHDKGYDEIYYLCKHSGSISVREKGYCDAVKDLGVKGKALHYEAYSRSKSQLLELIQQVYTPGGSHIAVMCWNDVDAVNLLEVLQEYGYDVPGQIGIMGFDDMPMAVHTSPKLTTVSQPFDDMAFKAMDVLFQNAKNEDKSKKMKSIEVPGLIIERDSI